MQLEILKNSQENTCARASFLIKWQSNGCNFIKKESLVQMFSCEFSKFLRTPFLPERLRWLLLGNQNQNFVKYQNLDKMELTLAILNVLSIVFVKKNYQFFLFWHIFALP